MRRGTADAAAEQERVIAALSATGDTRMAQRLRRCMAAMTSRRCGGGHPWTCRGAGCAWCRRALGRRWWRGITHWLADDGAPLSLAALQLPHGSGGLRPAVRRLRRACRDVRDRIARRRRRWRAVAIAGMASGDGRALLLVRHGLIDREEVAEVFEARWPGAPIGPSGTVEPSWAMATADAVELARTRRGVEPLRVVVAPQRDAAAVGALRWSAAPDTPPSLPPMPIVF